MDDRLYRSRGDRMIAGVAGGLAQHYDLDPSLVRIGWALLMLLTGGIFLLLYIVMAIVVPEEPSGSVPGPAGDQWGPTPPATDPTRAATPASPSDPTTTAGAAGAPPLSGQDASRTARRERRRNDAPLVFGAILVIIGVLAFAGQAFPEIDWALLWPIGIIVIGAALILAASRRPRT